jgi:diaminohydroxyphosphoribosylaminopyrimidine deaminase / 5-amino-6-(5-phosphoribosylamino)uracil reductase
MPGAQVIWRTLKQSEAPSANPVVPLGDGQWAEHDRAAWSVVRALCAGETGSALSALDSGGLAERAELRRDAAAARGWSSRDELNPALRAMLDLYAPLSGREPFVIAHLGQSVDGFIAGPNGQSVSLNDHANIVHLHRLRALFQVVLVGRGTACNDNPRLTTRLVPGDNPVRVVVDLNLQCEPSLGLFNDGLAPTLLLAAHDAPARQYPSGTRVLRLKCTREQATVSEMLAALAAEGLHRIFIEGGGVTVSRALSEGLLSRLHVTVAPLLIGNGVTGISLPELKRFEDALRPPCQTFAMGRDVLFDFDLAR